MAVQTFVVPTRVISGNGAVAEIGPTLAAEGHQAYSSSRTKAL